MGKNKNADESEEELKNEQQEEKWRKLRKGDMLKRYINFVL